MENDLKCECGSELTFSTAQFVDNDNIALCSDCYRKYKGLAPHNYRRIMRILKEENDKLLSVQGDDDPGELVCTICTGGKPISEPVQTEDDIMYIAMCSGCQDWGEFVYEKNLHN